MKSGGNVDKLKKDLNESIVKPISDKMEPLIGRQSHFQLESLFTLEQGISEKNIRIEI